MFDSCVDATSIVLLLRNEARMPEGRIAGDHSAGERWRDRSVPDVDDETTVRLPSTIAVRSSEQLARAEAAATEDVDWRPRQTGHSR